MTATLAPVFDALRETILLSSEGMDVATDEPGNVVVKTRWIDGKSKEPAWFGAVQLKKNYVSYHLMPLYNLPDLKGGISSDLNKRMQGKSCFNFKKSETGLFDELGRLTGLCAAAYASAPEAKPH